MSRFLRDTLAEDYRVTTARDGQAGLEEARRARPDLIVTDIMMPRLSGDQLVPAIRRHRELDGTPIILLTAKADEAVRVQLLQAGAQDFRDEALPGGRAPGAHRQLARGQPGAAHPPARADDARRGRGHAGRRDRGPQAAAQRRARGRAGGAGRGGARQPRQDRLPQPGLARAARPALQLDHAAPRPAKEPRRRAGAAADAAPPGDGLDAPARAHRLAAVVRPDQERAADVPAGERGRGADHDRRRRRARAAGGSQGRRAPPRARSAGASARRLARADPRRPRQPRRQRRQIHRARRDHRGAVLRRGRAHHRRHRHRAGDPGLPA